MVSAHSTAAGHVLSGRQWLDLHFAACRTEYQDLLRLVPFGAGDVVLDAGCGTGSFIPLLQEAVDPTGVVIPCDISVDHLSMLGAGFAADVRRLPLRDDTLDGVWSANVSQYFDDTQLADFLDELSRVVRPGGLVALKDVDMRAWDVRPAPAFLGSHLAEACARSENPQSAGSIRGRGLGRILEDAGFEHVRQQSRVIERRAPLDEATRGFWTEWLVYLSTVAGEQDLNAEDRSFWQSVATPEQSSAFVASPRFYGCEVQVVVYGYKPEPRDD